MGQLTYGAVAAQVRMILDPKLREINSRFDLEVRIVANKLERQVSEINERIDQLERAFRKLETELNALKQGDKVSDGNPGA